jgi:hypothetical protein
MRSNYSILGIQENSTISEIKKAYRKKAKLLHPDKNNSKNAHQQFIELNRAYEEIIYRKTNKSSSLNKFEEELRREREEASKRAEKHAQMKYEEYINSDFYKNTQAAKDVLNQLYIISSILILLTPLIFYLFKGLKGLFMGIIITIIFTGYWGRIFKMKIQLNPKSFISSFLSLSKTTSFKLLIISITNILLFFKYTLNTEINAFYLIVFFLILVILYVKNSKNKFQKIKFNKDLSIKHLKFLLAFNFLFAINCLFALNGNIYETYNFQHQRTNTNEKTTYIHLENSKYNNQPWFRTFFDYDAMVNKNKITYTFRRGCLGLRVLVNHEFK